jgi:hypothetical protein
MVQGNGFPDPHPAPHPPNRGSALRECQPTVLLPGRRASMNFDQVLEERGVVHAEDAEGGDGDAG